MKRDVELVRKILTALIDHPHGYAPHTLALVGYTDEQIGYHSYLMHQDGLVHAIDETDGECSGPMWRIESMTNAGYDFADAARNDTIWAKAEKKG